METLLAYAAVKNRRSNSLGYALLILVCLFGVIDCGGDSNNPNAPDLINWPNNYNGKVVLDGNGESFGVTVSRRRVYSNNREFEITNSHVNDGDGVYLNSNYIGLVKLVPFTSGGKIAVFAYEKSDEYYFLDLYTDSAGLEIFEQTNKRVASLPAGG